MSDDPGKITVWPQATVSTTSRPFHLLAGTQLWLQGWPDKSRPRLAVRLGNLVSDIRFAFWRCFGKDWI
jgi:hypothetical protein